MPCNPRGSLNAPVSRVLAYSQEQQIQMEASSRRFGVDRRGLRAAGDERHHVCPDSSGRRVLRSGAPRFFVKPLNVGE